MQGPRSEKGLGVILKESKLFFYLTFYRKTDYFIFYRKVAAMKVKLLFLLSFVLASAALVQHGVKLPLSNKVEGSENTCCCIMRFVEKRFLWLRFLLLKLYKFHHTMLVLNAFPAIPEFLNLKISRESMPLDEPPLVDSR